MHHAALEFALVAPTLYCRPWLLNILIHVLKGSMSLKLVSAELSFIDVSTCILKAAMQMPHIAAELALVGVPVRISKFSIAFPAILAKCAHIC